VTQTDSAIDPETATFEIALTSREARGTRAPVTFEVPLDLDLQPEASITRIAGPDGVAGTADDGTLFETFDLDRGGNGQFDLSDGRAGYPNDTIGYTVGTAQGGLESLGGIGCAGFNVPPQDPACSIEADNDMGWHIHCPPDSPLPCPPTHTVSGPRTYYATPADGVMAFSGNNSLHWGKHPTDSRRDDTTSCRELAAFTTRPVNLTPLPVAGDLELGFFHIAMMMDNNGLLGLPPGQSVDHGDVQVRVDRDPDPAADDWGFWGKLAPFENVYDHVPYIWSYWGTSITYCNLTPTDTGSDEPAPRGVRETMCMPLGVWSHCGNAWGTTHTYQCPGPGHRGTREPASGALWVRSRFSLAGFLGQRVQIRWIAQGWEFDPYTDGGCYDSQYGSGWATSIHNDGWWVDDIRLTGAIETQATPLPDTGAPPPSATCPATPDGACDESVGDRGYLAAIIARDIGNRDGVFEAGERIELDASGTANPGGCVDGVALYRFLRDGAVARDFTADPLFRDSPVGDTTYRVLARCSRDPACTSEAGAAMTVPVYTGDGGDIALRVSHDRAGGRTTVLWTARPQPAPLSGYDLFAGVQAAGSAPDAALLTLQPVACGVAAGAPPGDDVVVPVADGAPAEGSAFYYLAGHHHPEPAARAPLGRSSGGAVRLAPVACP
jgi:hypothetical protein